MIQSPVYEWRPGSHIAKISAQAAGERLESLRQEHGELTPELVVEDARPGDALLHPVIFDRSMHNAAEQWWLVRARELLRSVVIMPPEKADERPPRAFVVVNETGNEQVYTSIAVAMSDDQLRAQVIARALREARSWEARYREYAELAAIFAEIDRASKAA